MFRKLLVLGLILAILIAGATYYYVFIYAVEHHRDVNQETAIAISARALSDAFSTNEQAANQKYLNKAMDVKGAVLTISQDQSGKKTLLMGSEMALSNVLITLKDSTTSIKIGDTIRVKAICTGYLSDVVLTDGIVQH